MQCIFIILNYNDSQTTINLVDKLLHYSSVEKIIIIDNKSPDNSFKVLKNYYNTMVKVVLLQSPKNGGYSYGNNIGINYVLNHNFNSECVVISNPDIFIAEQDLNGIIHVLDADKTIGVAAPMMKIAGADTFKISAWRQPCYLYDCFSSVPFFRRWADKFICYDKPLFIQPIMCVDVLPGSFLAIQKQILQKGIKFDDRFFLFCEERIICEKIRNLEYKVVLSTLFSYDHYESISIKKSYSKAIARQRLLNDSKKKYYKLYRSKNHIRNFLLFLLMDFNFFLMQLRGLFK